MVTILTVLVVVSMLATLGVMFAGMLGLVRDEKAGGARSNALMRWRVILQFMTILLFITLLMVR
jgi:hypothetical protein